MYSYYWKLSISPIGSIRFVFFFFLFFARFALRSFHAVDDTYIRRNAFTVSFRRDRIRTRHSRLEVTILNRERDIFLKTILAVCVTRCVCVSCIPLFSSVPRPRYSIYAVLISRYEAFVKFLHSITRYFRRKLSDLLSVVRRS